MKQVHLTESQQNLQEHIELQLRIFLSRSWDSPRFPWPLVVSQPHYGTTTAVTSVGLPTLVIDLLQWSIIGGRGTPTLVTILKWAEKQIGIVLLKNFHMFNAGILEIPWYKAVQTELQTLLDGRANIESLIEAENIERNLLNIRKNLFFIGVGNWKTKDGKPILSNKDEYRDSHANDLTTPLELLSRFHSQPTFLEAPTYSDWLEILAVQNIPATTAKELAKQLVNEEAPLTRLGEVLITTLMDRGLPELADLVKRKENKGDKEEEQKPIQTSDLTKDRLKLLLCKVYGDTSGYKMLQTRIATTVENLDNGQDISDQLEDIISGIESSQYGKMKTEVGHYFAQNLNSALALANKLKYQTT